MEKVTIRELAYLLKQPKMNGQPQPIFFLGAGASKSGNIPLAGEIKDKILTDHPDNPFIKKLDDDEIDYAKLMGCLSPYERNKLPAEYIDNAKINVTHIYLAQMMKEGHYCKVQLNIETSSTGFGNLPILFVV